MSLPASVLRALLERGVDPDAIVAAAEAVEAEEAAAREAKLDKRREGNRRRQKAWYDRHVRDNGDNGVSSDYDQANQANAVSSVMNVRDGAEQKPPTPPITTYPDKTPSLPSEASGLSSARERRHEWPVDYREQLWAAYRRKTDRKKAMVVLDRLYAADRTPWEPILVGAQTLSASDTGTEYLPHASTWLRNERWADELPIRNKRPDPPPPRGPPGQRLSGPTQAYLARRAEQTDAAPTLDLQPARRPYPVRRPDPAEPAPGDGGTVDGDAEGARASPAGNVHDLRDRRAFG